MKQIIFLLTLLMACVMPQNADAQDEHYISLRSMGESYDFRVNSVDSIVTIRVSADEGYVVSSVSVTAGGNAIKTVKRTNDSTDGTPQTYYTFVMPKSDVVVTPMWKRVE